MGSLASLRAERDRGAGAIGPQAEAAAKPAALAADCELPAACELRCDADAGADRHAREYRSNR